MKIQNEQVFGVPVGDFSIGASESGYELHFSVDGEKFTSIGKTTPSNENHIIAGASKNLYWKCVGNEGEILVQW